MLKPTPKMKKWCFTGVLVLALLTVGTTPGIAIDKFNQTLGISIHGYDTVAYHTENHAVKGKSEFSYEWNDTKWHFASAENRDLFAADPDRYAPQYGGY
jgi:YHS domain-containing protein